MKLKFILVCVFFLLVCSTIATAALPDYFDWANKNGENWMTGVKDQGGCGSCWAHAALGVVEAQYNILYDNSEYDNKDSSNQSNLNQSEVNENGS